MPKASDLSVRRLDERGRLIDALMRPSSVLILGASARKFASANQALANLTKAGYNGSIHVVHRDAVTIDGYPTIPAVDQAPNDLDVALVSLPAAAVTAALEQLEERGCKSAVVPSVGLSEKDRAAIRAMTARGRMVVHGPNTIGLVNNADGIPLVFWSDWLTQEARGNVSLVAQSGGATVGVIKSMQRRAISKIIGTGSEWGLTTSDYLKWLAEDPTTSAVGVVLESVVDVGGFIDAVHRLRDTSTRLAVLNVGRTSAGAALATAHTSGLVGRADAYRAFFDELDVPVVDDYDELASVLDCLGTPEMPAAEGKSIAVVTESGGIAALVADLAGDTGSHFATFSPETKTVLAEVLPGSDPLNPFDSGSSVAWTGENFAAAITAIGRDPAVHGLLAVVDAQSGLTENEFAHERENVEAIALAASQVVGKPFIVASSSSVDVDDRWRSALGVRTPLVRGIRNGLVALDALARNRAPVTLTGQVGAEPAGPAQRIVADPETMMPGSLPVGVGRELLEAYGIPLVRSMQVSTPEDAAQAASDLGFPVVIKAVSPDVPHRSDIGGVISGITTPQAAQEAATRIRERVYQAFPSARMDGFEVQEQLTSPFEVMIGSVVDPVFGPVVTVGLGGVLVEVLGDLSLALAPVSEERARFLIDGTRLGSLMNGYRNLVPTHSGDALGACVSAFSRLVSDASPAIVEAELNPVLIDSRTGQVAAVDWLFVATSPKAIPDPTVKSETRKDLP